MSAIVTLKKESTNCLKSQFRSSMAVFLRIQKKLSVKSLMLRIEVKKVLSNLVNPIV